MVENSLTFLNGEVGSVFPPFQFGRPCERQYGAGNGTMSETSSLKDMVLVLFARTEHLLLEM